MIPPMRRRKYSLISATTTRHASETAQTTDPATAPTNATAITTLTTTGAKVKLAANAPPSPCEIAREFRDLAGHLNQELARRAKEVYWMVFGIPIEVKKVSATVSGGSADRSRSNDPA